MCYSALIRQDVRNIAKEFGADIASPLLEFVYESEHHNPYKIKWPGSDGRIYPNYHAPVVSLNELGGCELRAMRYSAFPPAYVSDDSARKLSTFNARRDSLHKRFWSDSVLERRGVLVIKAFYEWVSVRNLIQAGVINLDDIKAEFERQSLLRKQSIEKSGKKYKPTPTELKNPLDREVVISFNVKDGHDLVVPVIYSQNPEKSDWGFAIITDEPTPEIRAAGHDRMPVVLEVEQSSIWLSQEKRTLDAWVKFLEMKEKLIFCHQLAKAA